MAGLITLEVLGDSPLADAVRATNLTPAEPVAWICEATTNRDQLAELIEMSFIRRVIVSAPVPVGTLAWLEDIHIHRVFAYIPENVRRASAVTDFQNADRFIIGTRHEAFYELLVHMLAPWGAHFHLVTPESAEMTKLALNSFLSLNIAFMHEIDDLCRATGANADEVSRALLTERRISPSAPLRPGPSWGGDHLARDVKTLQRMAEHYGVMLPLIRQLRSEG